jgi:hypothetical protein
MATRRMYLATALMRSMPSPLIRCYMWMFEMPLTCLGRSMSLARWKAIKPGPFNDQAMSDALRVEMKKWGEEDAIPEFEKVTTGWQGEVPFWVQDYRAGGTWIRTLIIPSEPDSLSALKWLWLDKGTEPHIIAPKKEGGRLIFASNYTAGSTPGSLETVPATRDGPMRSVLEVMHPGNQPRGWTEMLVEKLRDSYYQRAQIGFAEAARASGHGRS